MVDGPISEKLMSILACPDCKGDLSYNSDRTGLVCSKCKVTFEIKDGVPILMPKKS